MNIGKAFSYQFEDPDWIKKIGIAAVISLIPLVGGIVVAGWGIEIARRVIQQNPNPLPDWDDFMAYLIKGLKMMVITLVYMLPIILVSACPAVLTTVAGNQGEDVLMTIASIISICFSCLVILYGVFVGLAMPVALGRFAATDEISAAFRFGEIISAVRAKPMVYVMVLLGGFVASLVASLGAILCGIGILFTVPYAISIQGHLWGQAYLEGGQPLSGGYTSMPEGYTPTMQV